VSKIDYFHLLDRVGRNYVALPIGANLSPFTAGEGIISLATVSHRSRSGKKTARSSVSRWTPEIRRERNGSLDQIGAVDRRLDDSHLMKYVDPVDRP
jgi:hypothetical protein